MLTLLSITVRPLGMSFAISAGDSSSVAAMKPSNGMTRRASHETCRGV